MAAFFLVKGRAAGPARQELVQLVAGVGKIVRMHVANGANRGVAVHHIVETIHQPAHARVPAEQVVKRFGHEAHSDLKTEYAAATVPAMSASVCAVETKP